MPSTICNRFLLLYGSQTGQAKAISEEIAEKAEKFDLRADLHCLSQTEKKFNLEREHCVVIVTSTTGDGDPPDTAQKFVRRLKKKTLPSNHLENLNFALLGLGDSNYTNFCNNGKLVDKRLEQLGAKRFYDSGWADDAVGLEIAVEPWIDGLFPALQKFLNVSESQNVSMGNSGDCGTNGHCTSSIELGINGSKMSPAENGDSIQTDTDITHTVSEKSVIESSNDQSRSNGLSTSLTNNNGDSNSEDCTVSKVIEDSKLNLSKNLSNGSQSNNILEANSSQNAIQPDNTKESDTESCVHQPSLTVSVPPLSESALSLPVMPAEYLKCTFCDEKPVKLNDIPLQNGCPLPSAASQVTMATVISAEVLTREDAVKKTLCLRLDTQNKLGDYLPGDSISIIVQNTIEEVEALLERLCVENQTDSACSISVVEGTKKKNAAVPSHIPPHCTLRHIFTTCLDVREPPKKALLRVFVQHTTDPGEKRRLQELCSKQGASDYTSYIRQPSVSVLDVLSSFPSCHPPVESLLEHLPRLQPRPYSICSSPLVDSGVIEIVFNKINIPKGEGRTYSRDGLCTGMLDKLTQGIQGVTRDCGVGDVADYLKTVDINSQLQIPVFSRTNQHFYMSEDLSIPIIMVGPGTGVAPFVGFLRHREVLKCDVSDKIKYGETWLFYGCRHQDRDYIYRNELEDFHTKGVLTRLCVCFSRDEQDNNAPKYVQDNIRKHVSELSTLIMEKNAMVFVCGDAKNMAKDINEAILSIIQSYKGCSLEEARAEVMKMRLHKRYLEDVWT